MKRPRLLRYLLIYLAALTLVAVFSGPLAVALEGGERYASWREARAASLTSHGLAPRPEDHSDAVIQVYSARTWGLKKAVSVHTWIAAKRADEAAYRVYEVIGWRQRRGLSVVSRSTRPPDGSWYGNPPTLLSDLRGAAADRLIDRIETAADSYPWAKEYTAWPGPNSNTFTAWIGRQVPELGLDLPSTAIGKDYAGLRDLFGPPISGSGIQVSLYGLLSVSAGTRQGLEFSVLGLSLELDILDAAVEIPGFGRIGPDPV